jgi:hypothetical protein
VKINIQEFMVWRKEDGKDVRSFIREVKDTVRRDL